MKNFRIGNDLQILWSIYAPGEKGDVPMELGDKDVHLFVTNVNGREEVEFKLVDTIEPSAVHNIVEWNFLGSEQRVLGPYTLTLEIKSSEKRTIMVDQCHPFSLVAKTCLEKDALGGYNINKEQLTLDSRLSIIRVQPIIPMICRKTPDDGNEYWCVDEKNTGSRVTGDSTYQLAEKHGLVFPGETEGQWTTRISMRVFDGGGVNATFGGSRRIDGGDPNGQNIK